MVEIYRCCSVRFQLPYSGETGPGELKWSFEPVARNTPPAVNDATAVKDARRSLMRVTANIQDPSIGAANPDRSSSALAVEIQPPTRAITAEAITNPLARRFRFLTLSRIVITISLSNLKSRVLALGGRRIQDRLIEQIRRCTGDDRRMTCWSRAMSLTSWSLVMRVRAEKRDRLSSWPATCNTRS